MQSIQYKKAVCRAIIQKVYYLNVNFWESIRPRLLFTNMSQKLGIRKKNKKIKKMNQAFPKFQPKLKLSRMGRFSEAQAPQKQYIVKNVTKLSILVGCLPRTQVIKTSYQSLANIPNDRKTIPYSPK